MAVVTPIQNPQRRPTEAFRFARLFDLGIGNVIVTRFKADGRTESGVFLIDVFCLGVKDAFFAEFNSHQVYHDRLIGRIQEESELIPMAAAAARKLVEGAVAWAAQLGFAPAPDYRRAARVFGGLSAAEHQEEFVFGDQGKPLFAAGPNDGPERCRKILAALHRRCGPDGYHYILPVDVANLLVDEPWFTPPGDELAISPDESGPPQRIRRREGDPS